MFDSTWITDLDAASACEAVLGTQSDLREAEWREIALAARWAVLHEPPAPPDGEPTLRQVRARTWGEDEDGGPSNARGRERVRRAGGKGTPWLREFAAAELATLMGVGIVTAAGLIRDAVDLRHRHPVLWSALGEGRGRVWKARQVARLTRVAGLTRDQARFVDAATTPYVDSLGWPAFLRLVEAKIIEADPHAAEERRRAAALDRFVATGRCNENGLKTLVAKATAGDVVYFVAVCDRIAQLLLLRGDTDPVGARRSKALGILANPAAALALLEQHTTDDPHPEDPDQSPLSAPGTERSDTDGRACGHCGGPRVDPERLRPRAVLHVRITEEALRAGAGVAAAGEGIGPLTLQAVRELLAHHRVSVRPVLDLRGQVPVDAYEVPAAMREALRLARLSTVFPFSATDREPDLDHTKEFVPLADGGAPGQTRVDNLGPLHRLAHRLKTHACGWHLDQPRPGVYLWRTPHGYWYQVDNDGTHPLGRDPDLTPSAPALSGSPPRPVARHRRP